MTGFMPDHITVHPSVYALRTFIRSVVRETGSVISGYANMEYKSFTDELFRASANDSGFDSVKRTGLLLSGSAKFLYVRDLLNSRLAEGNAGSSFVRMIERIITEIREAGVSPDSLKKASERLAASGFSDFAGLSFVSDVFGGYCRGMFHGGRRRFYDLSDKKEDVVRYLGLCAEGRGRVPFLENVSGLEFRNVYSLTELDFRIVKALSSYMASKGGTLVFALPYNADRQDAFRFLENRVESFERLGDSHPELTLSFSFSEIPRGVEKNRREYVANNIFRNHLEKGFLWDSSADGVRSFPKDDLSAEIFRAPDPESELDSVFRRIKRLSIEGMRLSSMAIVSPRPDAIRGLARDLSERYSVPVVFSSGRLLSTMPVSSFLLTPLKILSEGISFELARDLFCSPFANPLSLVRKNGGLSDAELEGLPSALSHEIMEAASRGGYLENTYGRTFLSSLSLYASRLPERRKALLDRLEENPYFRRDVDDIDAVYPSVRLFLLACSILAERIAELRASAEKGVPDVHSFVKWLLDSLGVEDMIIGRAGVGGIDGPVFVNENLDALGRFKVFVINSASGFKLMDCPFDFGVFFDLVRDEVSHAYVAAGAQNDGVTVLSPADAVGRRFSCVFMTGLNEGSFPEFREENPYLSDAAKKALAGMLRRLEREDRRRAEREFIEEAGELGCRATRERLDRLGELYSRILRDQMSISPFVTSKMLYWEQAFLFLSCVNEAEEKVVFSFSKADSSGVLLAPSYYLDQVLSLLGLPEQGGRDALSGLDERPDGIMLSREDVHERLLGLGAGAGDELSALLEADFPGLFGEFRSAERNAARTVSSSCDLCPYGSHDEFYPPTELEDYASCPFKFFVRRVLRLRDKMRYTLEDNAVTRGNVIHLILQKYYEGGKRPFDPFDRVYFDRIVDEVLREYESFAEICHRSLADNVRRRIRLLAGSWLEKDIREGCGCFRRTETERILTLSMRVSVRRVDPDMAVDPSSPRVGSYSLPLDPGSREDRTIRFSGRADRIDYNESSFRMVDYKTGSSSSLSNAHKRNPSVSLQAPMYFAALKQDDFFSGLEGRFVYSFFRDLKSVEPDCFSGKGPFDRYFERDPLEIERLRAEDSGRRFLVEDLSDIVSGIEGGYYEPVPYGGDCGYCSFAPLCRRPGADGTGGDS